MFQLTKPRLTDPNSISPSLFQHSKSEEKREKQNSEILKKPRRGAPLYSARLSPLTDWNRLYFMPLVSRKRNPLERSIPPFYLCGYLQSSLRGVSYFYFSSSSQKSAFYERRAAASFLTSRGWSLVDRCHSNN